MKDTLETNLPEEAGKLEETKKPVETPEIDATADVEANDTAEADAAIAAGKLTKEEILAKLTELVETSVETSRGEVEALKQAYYKIRRNEVEELKKEFIADGGEEKDFTAPADETENKIKDLLTSYKEKRAAILAEEERVKAANYALKLQLIDQLKELCESQDDFNKLYNSFKDIQQRWKEVKAVPQEHVIYIRCHLIHAIRRRDRHYTIQPRLAKSTDHQIDGLVTAIAQEDRATVHAFQHGQTILQFPLQGIGITVIRHIPRILIRVQKNGGIPMKLITCG